MNPIISVQGLGKRYVLRREAATRYRSLREDIPAALKRFGSNLVRRGLAGPSAATKEDFWALRDVNFDVHPGDRLGVIGRNGAGKSTLLKVLSRITDPSAGRIEIRGRVSSLLEVGTGFHPELSGRENIFLNGAILGMRNNEVRQKFDQIVDFAQIERFLDTPVKRYSSGMYVRLAFAVAAHLEPDILIVDEVLAVGDAQFQKKCLGRMEELSKTGRTILFVTHNMDAMLALCNRSIVLDGGQVVFDGDAHGGRQHYLDQAASTEYSVAQHGGRGGSGGVVIEDVWVDPATEPNALLTTGGAVSLRLRARVGPDYMGRNELDVAFGIDSIDGQRLYTVISSWSATVLDVASGHIRARCEIEEFPLVAGQYLVSATVLFRGETLDSIRHCASFEVMPKVRAVHVERLAGWGVLDLPCRFTNDSA